MRQTHHNAKLLGWPLPTKAEKLLKLLKAAKELLKLLGCPLPTCSVSVSRLGKTADNGCCVDCAGRKRGGGGIWAEQRPVREAPHGMILHDTTK